MSGTVIVLKVYFAGISVFIFFLLDVEVEKPEKKKTFREEFSWVDVLQAEQAKSFLVNRFVN